MYGRRSPTNMAKLARINKALHGRQENAASILRIKQTHIRHLQWYRITDCGNLFCHTHTYTHMQQSLLSKLVQQCAPSVYPLMMQTLLLFLSSTHAGHLIQSYFRRASDRTGSPYGDGHPMPECLCNPYWNHHHHHHQPGSKIKARISNLPIAIPDSFTMQVELQSLLCWPMLIPCLHRVQNRSPRFSFLWIWHSRYSVGPRCWTLRQSGNRSE